MADYYCWRLDSLLTTGSAKICYEHSELNLGPLIAQSIRKNPQTLPDITRPVSKQCIQRSDRLPNLHIELREQIKEFQEEHCLKLQE